MLGQSPAPEASEILTRRLQQALGEAYHLERELGGGGMSRVFLASEAALDRKVVVKLLSPELVSPTAVARFKQEFEVTAKLQHPHILPVLATGAQGDLLYYVMPYVEGESLRQRLLREHRLQAPDAVRLLYEISDALAHAHSRGVVHRDIKPENILLVDGHAVLSDFGIARVLSRDDAGAEGTERLTDAGTSLGTLGYMAPEQLAGESTVDGRADQYALGVVGYEMLSGNRPFEGETLSALLRSQLSKAPLALIEREPSLPPDLSACIARSLEQDPNLRFGSSSEFRDALGLGFTTGALPRAPRMGVRRRALLSTVAVAVLSIAGVLVVRRAQSTSEFEPNLLAVAPFDALGVGLDMWREGMVDLLSANLDGAGNLHTVSPTVVIRRWSGRADETAAAALAKTTRAALTVYGRIVRSGADSVRVQASVYDALRARSIGEYEFRTTEAGIDRTADSIALGILTTLRRTMDVTLPRRASLGSASLAAVRAYLRGEQFYRHAVWDSAATYFLAAVTADSGFAPAMRRLSNALEWKKVAGFDTTWMVTYALKAGAANHGLAPRESLLVAADSQWKAMYGIADLAQRRTMAGRLFRTLGTASVQFPNDPEVWFRVGDVRYHFWPFDSTATLTSAGTAFRTAIGLDSAFAPSYLHLIDIALSDQRIDSARAFIGQYLYLQPDAGDAKYLSALDALLDRDRTMRLDLDSLVATLHGEPIRLLYEKLVMVADPDTALVRLLRAFARDSITVSADPAAVRRGRRRIFAEALADRGRFVEARKVSEEFSLGYVGPMSLLGAIPADTAARKLREPLTIDLPGEALEGTRWWVERRDTTSLRDALQVTRRFEARYGIYGMALRQAAEAYLALARRDTTRAMSSLGAIRHDNCPWPACDVHLLTLGQLRAAQGQWDGAAEILNRPPRMRGPTRVQWVLERGRVAERRGERVRAADSYRFVVNAWDGGDAVVLPTVIAARAGLARVEIK